MMLVFLEPEEATDIITSVRLPRLVFLHCMAPFITASLLSLPVLHFALGILQLGLSNCKYDTKYFC